LSDLAISILAKSIFGASLILIIYVVYREWKITRINAEQNEISLGEKTNEDIVASLTNNELVDALNKELGSGNTTPKK
jgi:hypothetical protein